MRQINELQALVSELYAAAVALDIRIDEVDQRIESLHLALEERFGGFRSE